MSSRSPALTYDTTPRSDLRRFGQMLRLAGRDLLEQLTLLGMGNLATAAATIILPLLPFALAGMWHVAAAIAEEEEPGWEAFWDGATGENIRPFLAAVVAAAGYALCWMNVRFYARPQVPLPFPADARAILVLRLFWGAMALLWTLLWLYAGGVMALDRLPPGKAAACAFRLLRDHPLFAFLLGALVVAVLALTAFVPAILVLLFWAVLATISVRSVQLLRHGYPIPRPPG